MKVVPFQRLACPLDAQPLRGEASRRVCDSGHSYDIASKGYTHLLPVQHKRSREPGDSKAMVAARRRFLGAGYYRPIAEAVASAALSDAEGKAELSCLDAGCGEGYYLRQLAAADSGVTLHLLGLDISKWAVQAAARQDARPTWVVASNARIPAEPASLDRILCLFGFPVYPEFFRVLKPGGLLIKVDAGAGHLKELRDLIYAEEKTAAARDEVLPPEYSRLGEVRVQYPLQLEGSDNLADLLAMTPHYHRASVAAREALLKLEGLTVSVDVRVVTYISRASASD
ncbi:putative RNA methyltransferase [Parahaliea aestuarii]|uniref:Methyltransferase domain-containing protein n=1 Tax=Parahaliea aestuarii TaxID=1852021 RepID=A0A5C8ZME3_9GAMM|nr:methyltransferase domain-containing protein [Parahaliea aestuarii]TXS89355.1 methyltransferase domain-containing protein [Parahaliea aestuarii]